MRRPDVFTLDYSHPLAQGLVFAGLLDKTGRDLSILQNKVQQNGGNYGTGLNSIGRTEHRFNGSTNSGLKLDSEPEYSNSILQISTHYFTASYAFMYFIAKGYGAASNTFTWALGMDTSQLFFGAGTSSDGVWMKVTDSRNINRDTHVSVLYKRSISSADMYIDAGLVASSGVKTASPTNTEPLYIGNTGRPANVRLSDMLIHNRALSTAEIALLADRTDPMLGGLIVEERPVLYFDMGGSTDITGPVVFQNSAAIGMSSAKQAAGAVSVSNTSAVSVSGEKSVNVPIPMSAVSSIGASGAKSVLFPAVFEHASGLGISGVKTENMLGGGDVFFEHASAVGLAGQKQAVAWLGIVASSLIGISGTKEALMPELAGAYSVNNRTSVVRGGVYTNKSGGTLYAVLTLSGTKPSVAQVKAGQNHLGAAAQYATSKTVSSVGLQTFEAWWLNPGTTFYWHFVWTDAEAEGSVVVTSPAVSTLAAVVGTKESFDGDFPSTQLEQSGTTAIVQSIKVVQ